jgi:hypothetical protein
MSTVKKEKFLSLIGFLNDGFQPGNTTVPEMNYNRPCGFVAFEEVPERAEQFAADFNLISIGRDNPIRLYIVLKRHE